MEVKGLKFDDCILFLVRDYSVPENYAPQFKHVIKTSYNVSSTQGRVFAGINVFKTWKNIDEFDALVDAEIKGNDFIWYAQICHDDFCSLMVSKKNCKGYYVIEDGLGSYLQRNPQTFTGLNYWIYKLILRPLFPRIFLVKNHFIETNNKKFRGCIATDKSCFPLHQQYLEVVGNPFEKEELDHPVDAILSVDPLYMFMSDDVVEKVYADLATFIKDKNYQHLCCKFHPYLNAKSNADKRHFYERLLKKHFGDDIKELGSDVVLENVFSTYGCDFYTNHSSVCLYAHNMGAKCYTYNPIIKKYKPDYNAIELVKKYCIEIPLN